MARGLQIDKVYEVTSHDQISSVSFYFVIYLPMICEQLDCELCDVQQQRYHSTILHYDFLSSFDICSILYKRGERGERGGFMVVCQREKVRDKDHGGVGRFSIGKG